MLIKNFIVFEGIDGAGTTSQLRLIEKKYCTIGQTDCLITTSEPTANHIGRLIRQTLAGNLPMSAEAIAALFAADRAEHLYGKNGIVEHCAKGIKVVSDRYLFSSLAYQDTDGAGNFATHFNALFPFPEVLFFFDIPADIAMRRVGKRGEKTEIYEKTAFQQKVSSAYQRILAETGKKEPAMRIVVIDATQSIKKIHEKIWTELKKMPTH